MSPGRPIPHDGAMNTTALLTAAPTAPPEVGAALIDAHDLTRIWGKGDAAQIGISGVDLQIRRGELVAVIGPSGSGKSTLGALIVVTVVFVLVIVPAIVLLYTLDQRSLLPGEGVD